MSNLDNFKLGMGLKVIPYETTRRGLSGFSTPAFLSIALLALALYSVS